MKIGREIRPNKLNSRYQPLPFEASLSERLCLLLSYVTVGLVASQQWKQSKDVGWYELDRECLK